MAFIDSYKPKTAFVVSYYGEQGEKNMNGCTVMFASVPELVKRLR